jgi:serine O-acetyltransferase
MQPVFFFKGFHAAVVYRVSHVLWKLGPEEQAVALFLQSRTSELFGMDIHPGATIGNGVMFDHATGIVIGSTAIIGNDCYILHSVTLGATGKPCPGKRHPTLGNHCIMGANSTVLGDIVIGDGSTVGAAAVVTKSVPEGTVIIGVNQVVKKKELAAASPDDGDEYTWFYGDYAI